ncbi:hypothetical protein OF117_11445 [Geodermatophilus sp. YIM 151500]|uniref:hypothetical protein n=1 Tax=Geodermatophilus sp. YIM 151500 TaxID=2984531 RepID=UPI0021E385EB|nr:hypothetical protein [Geodermatophilus sp. YIM 151500]MCV2489974.1 hypothetical protein [Geodermatophilus sp. YIM 151500]
MNARDTQQSIPNHRITDERSFEAVTRDPRQVAGAYFYLQMDCLVAYAYQVSLDFFRRPQLHTDLGRGTRELVARLRARYGNDERVPSQEQRDEIFQPLFGQSSGSPPDGQGDFPRLRDDLVGAAAAFAERVFDTGEEMLRERVRTTHRPFKDYLLGLQGDSLIWSTDDALSDVARRLAYPILHSPGVSAVFGISSPPRDQWPFAEDANADKLIEEISKRVLARMDHTGLTREGISNRQRAALRGAEALATILDFREENADDRDLDLLITKCYTWGSALKSLGGQPTGLASAQPAYMG